MGRIANDGRGRLGGRALGTKNKPQPAVGEWVETLLNKNRRAVELAVTTGDRGIIAALLVVSALNRVTEALDAVRVLPEPDDGDGVVFETIEANHEQANP